MMDTKEHLSRQTIFLHWTVALGMIGILASGVYMDEFDDYAVYPWHKSFGVLILGFVLWRVVWRWKNGWPEPVRQYDFVESLLASVVHWMLIVGTVLMPISGILMSGFGGYGVPFFGYELIGANPNPDNPSEVIAYSELLSEMGEELHEFGANLLILAIGLHIAGALKHHIIDKDNTLKRMLGK